jgi:hypothetical protein
MECFLQYLDDLDDLYGAFGLIWEKLRRTLLKLTSVLMVLAVGAGGISLALAHPPIALATSTMLFVTLLYRSVTVPSPRWGITSQ